MSIHDEFLKAIHEKKFVNITANSNEKGVIQRICVPFDFGPSRKYHDQIARYHFWDLNSPDGPHNLALLPDQLLALVMIDQTFKPGDYVMWTPKWIVPRDWGAHS